MKYSNKRKVKKYFIYIFVLLIVGWIYFKQLKNQNNNNYLNEFLFEYNSTYSHFNKSLLNQLIRNNSIEIQNLIRIILFFLMI